MLWLVKQKVYASSLPKRSVGVGGIDAGRMIVMSNRNWFSDELRAPVGEVS